MDNRMMNYYHKNGNLPDRYYNQMNGKTPYENIHKQHQKMIDEQEKKEKKEQLKQLMFEAMLYTLNEGVTPLESVAAYDTVQMMEDVFKDGTIHPERLRSKSYFAQLGGMLGQAMAMFPFKMLDTIWNDDGE